MAQFLPEDEQLTRCGNELDVLKGMITYAEKMIAVGANDGSERIPALVATPTARQSYFKLRKRADWYSG